ncbi:hypothetical protein LMG2828_02865 [Achromobacter piechaudii]|nr:hypothetical protein LMG2828_02865 [Achromobacter piechaudii]
MELHRFESFEEFQDAVVNADLAVRLLGPHDGKWRIGHLDVDGITVQQGIEAVPNLCEASGCPSHLMFLISEGRQSPTWLNGVPFAHDTLGVLPRHGVLFFGQQAPTPGFPLQCRSLSRCSWPMTRRAGYCGTGAGQRACCPRRPPPSRT